MTNIADWLIDNPEVDWIEQLQEALRTPHVQTYVY
jgi:hypothetical protein